MFVFHAILKKIYQEMLLNTLIFLIPEIIEFLQDLNVKNVEGKCGLRVNYVVKLKDELLVGPLARFLFARHVAEPMV